MLKAILSNPAILINCELDVKSVWLTDKNGHNGSLRWFPSARALPERWVQN